MGAYSARPDVEARLAALPEAGSPIEGADKIDARIEQGIEYADAEIDATLAPVYTVPFTKVPAIIRHISADLAAAFHLDGGFSGGGEDEPTKLATALRARAQALLCKLRDKEMALPSDTTEPAPEGTAAVVPTHSQLGQRPSLQCFDLYNEPTRGEL